MNIFWRQTKELILRLIRIEIRNKNRPLFKAIFTFITNTVFAIFLYKFISNMIFLPHTSSLNTFKDFDHSNPSVAFIYQNVSKEDQEIFDFYNSLLYLIQTDLNITRDNISVYEFYKISDFNSWVYDIQRENRSFSLLMGIYFNNQSNIYNQFKLTIEILYNGTSNNKIWEYYHQIERASWLTQNIKLNGNIKYVSNSQINSFISPFISFIACSTLVSIISSYMYRVVNDLKKDKRPYMEICNLNIFSYWTSSLIVDSALLIIISLGTGIIFCLAKIPPFFNNLPICLYALIVPSFSMILFSYSFSFLFNEPTSAYMWGTTLQTIPLFFILIIQLIFDSNFVSYLSPFIPLTNIYSELQYLISHSESTSKELLTDPTMLFLMISAIFSFPLYLLLIYLIERTKKNRVYNSFDREFQNHIPYFNRLRVLNDPRPEVLTEARNQANYENDPINPEYALRVVNVCKLFFDEDHKPIAAVNNFSLGVKDGELFGLLGANGAGKTTLMNIATGKISPSSGKIYIEDYSIEEAQKRQMFGLCPQQNTHLTDELTPEENIRLYGILYGYSDAEINSKTVDLISKLDIGEHIKKHQCELSGGNARKVSLAISLLSPSPLIFLDEPTSSLDPVSRHKVYEMINSIRQHNSEITDHKKTFVLCTHLLEEAEMLCDRITIMLGGCMYTIGTPEELSLLFGKEWKADLNLEPSNNSRNSLDEWIERELPYARLSTERPLTRIYSVPITEIGLPELFRKLRKGVNENVGIKSFSCCSSSLEKIFLELIMRQEIISQQAQDEIHEN